MSSEPETPTLHEISRLREDYGLTGEEDTHLVVFLSFLGGGFVLMTGLSSGGKDEVVSAAEYCVPDNWVFQIPTSVSKTVLYEMADDINSHPVHRHKDITNLSDKAYLEDIIKRHGDGRPISHSYTDVTGENRTEVEQTIYPPTCMVLFLASDNEQTDMNDFPELRNRALIVGIDDSKGLTERVNTRQAKQEAGIINYNIGPERTEEIREYVADIPIHTYSGRDPAGGFINPVMPAMDNQNPLPQHFTEARRDFPRLSDFMKSVTLFHHAERAEVPQMMWTGDRRIDNELTLLVTPADAWLGMRVFGEKMVLSALNLRDKDFHLLDILRSNFGQQFDVGTLQAMMRQRGWNITNSDVRGSLKNMKTKGYVRVDKSVSPNEWSASEFARQVDRDVQLDWPTVIEDTRELVYEHYPEPVAAKYDENHLQGDGLLVTHPFEGRVVNLMEEEANELEDTVDEKQEVEETVMDGSDVQEDDNDEDEDEDNPFQGTLT